MSEEWQKKLFGSVPLAEYGRLKALTVAAVGRRGECETVIGNGTGKLNFLMFIHFIWRNLYDYSDRLILNDGKLMNIILIIYTNIYIPPALSTLASHIHPIP